MGFGQDGGPVGPFGDHRRSADDRIAVEISFSALGEPLTVSAAVPRQAGLADMVPLARPLADALGRVRTRHERAAGRRVSCRRGCAACCRYAVPLSVPEALRLQNDLQALGDARRADLQASVVRAAGRLIVAAGAAGATSAGPVADVPDTADDIGGWYSGLNLPCPFLAADCCEIYSCRPIACREHLATSPPALCRGHAPGVGELVELPFSLTEALGLLAAEAEGADVEAVFLPLAAHWYAENAPRADRRWPAEDLVATLSAILTRLSDRVAAV